MSAVEKEVFRSLRFAARPRTPFAIDEEALIQFDVPHDEVSFDLVDALRSSWPVEVDVSPMSNVDMDIGISITASPSPFEDILSSKLINAKMTLARHAPAEDVFRRMSELIDFAADEYPETDIPSARSLSAALTFLEDNNDLPSPLLGLTSPGNVWAEWIKEDGSSRVALEFRKNGSITLAATFPDTDEPLRQASDLSGNLGPSSVSEKLRATPSFSWILEGS